MNRGIFLAGFYLPVAFSLLINSGWGGDWPQILGPRRDGQAVDEAPIPPWTDAGPPLRWTSELGQGYAGPAIAAGRVVVFHRVGDSERVEAWDASSGGRLWQTDFPANYGGGYNSDTGPRCVPVVHDQRVYLCGAGGQLHCVGLLDGRPRWSRDAYGDFGGSEGYFGAGSTPIVSDGKLLVNVGGRNAGLVAFQLDTGNTAWQTTREAASYSSPTAASINGKEIVVFVTRYNTVAVDPRDGSVKFQFQFGKRGPTVNAATPLVFGDRLFVSASYGVGARLARFGFGSVEILWENDDVMSSQYTTCVHRDGFLYGVHGREDFQNGELRCLEAESGTVRWTAPQVGVAHVILVNDQLLIVTVSGRLILAEASPTAYRRLAEAQLSEQLTRALPAYSDGRLFVRDADKLFCFAVN